MLAITIILIALMIFNNIYAINVVRNQVALSNLNMISLYMSQIDNGLKDVDQYLWSLQVSDNNLKIIESAQSDDEVLLAKIHLQETLSSALLINKYIDSFFIYSISTDDFTDIFKVGSGYSEREQIRSFIKYFLSDDLIKSQKLPSTWFIQQVGENYYLFRFLYSGTTFIGAWVDMKTLQIPLSPLNLSEYSDLFFMTQSGIPMKVTPLLQEEGVNFSNIESGYYITGTTNKYLVVGKPSTVGNFNLVAVIPDNKILEDLPSWIRFPLIILLGFFLLLPGYYFFLRKIVLIPLIRTTSAMKKFGDGNVDFRITENGGSDEFQMLNQSFNRMADQIEELKISVYEEQLDRQKVELQHLQLQINPHFFMNSLNIIFSLANSKKYDLIREMTSCLVHYFRYMFRSNLTFISLSDELEFVQNYLRIQDIRYPDILQCEICVPKSLLDVKIPPLILYTFVENTIIHQVSPSHPVKIAIAVELDESGLEPLLVITIRDNGDGFREDILSALNLGRRIVDEEGEHIGIWNVIHRLRLLYCNKASIHFSNGYPSGAMIKMDLPALFTEEDENESSFR